LCQLDQYYDVQTKQCKDNSLLCTINETYSLELHKCIKVIDCKVDEFYDDKVKLCVKKSSLCSEFEKYN